MSDASSNRDLKRLYQTYFEWLVSFLDEDDPIGLVVGQRLPSREYEMEARRIVPLVATETSADTLAVKIHSIFVHDFDSSIAGDTLRYLPMAAALLKKWRELQESLQP